MGRREPPFLIKLICIRMAFDIIKLSEQENILIKESEKLYGDYYLTNNERLSYFHIFISKKVEDEATIFVSFLGSILSNLTMTFLSILRRHENQANLMLRHVLESVVLSCYSLHKPDYNEFVEKDKNREYEDLQNVKNKAYSWFGENYKIPSDKIKDLKNSINKRHSHSNLGNTFFNVLLDHTARQTQIFFFDNRDINTVKGSLLGFCFIVCDLMDVISKVVKDYPLVELNPNFEETMVRFNEGNKRLFVNYVKENPELK